MKNISFKLIFRSWRRNKTFAVISIISLAVGIACTNLLAAFVIHEYNVEIDNPNRDRLVVTKTSVEKDGLNFFVAPSEVAFQLLNRVPELDRLCTVCEYENVTYRRISDTFFTEIKVIESDSTFLRLFPQKVVMGSLEDALVGPDRIVLSESSSKRLFGRNNPIGQTIQIQIGRSEIQGKIGLFTFTVSAVVKDNNQAAFSFDALFFDRPVAGVNFFLLKENVSVSDVQAKTTDLFIKNHRDVELKYTFSSIQEACLDLATMTSLLKRTNTNLLFIALFSAILILAIACFNYINLSFSRVFKQLYSIHVQKLMGAGSGQLSLQLFVDTFMTVGLGFLISQLIQYDLLGVMNRIMSVQVPVSFLYSSQVLPVTFGFILLLACIPALYMSRRLPEMSISGYNNFYRGKARRRIITSLAVMQFAISFVLIIGSFSVRRQVSLLYDKIENYRDVYSFSVGDFKTSMLPLKERISNLSGVQTMALSNGIDYWPLTDSPYEPYTSVDGDEEIMEVMGYKLLEGLPWKEAIKQYPNPVYLNRTWAQNLFPDGNIPIGHLIKEHELRLINRPPFGNDHVIVGVVEDYFKPYISNSLETPIDKTIISYTKDGFLLEVRLNSENNSVVKQIYEEWDKLYPDTYLKHEGLYDKMLSNNKKLFELSDLLMMYSVISILLTCFGLFGMSLYAIEQRTKEIGIRKVNGSTTWQIMKLLNRQFIGWIGIAYVIAAPIAWWLLGQWMQNFVYRAAFSIWTYILPLLIVVGVTLLTVSWHSYKAASGNPVNALRNE